MNSFITIPDILSQELPRICEEVPVIGGKYKTEPEDFRVDELPHTTWTGAGEYLYLQVEKRGMASSTLAQHIQAALDIPFSSIRLAGRKDKRAVTSQWVSILHGDASKLKHIEARSLRPGQHIKILDTDRHHAPMAFGVHGGNRFHIVIRDLLLTEPAWSRAMSIVKLLQRTGIPNYFGEQRLGEDYVELGKEILLDVYEGVPAIQARFLMSSYQAQLFNRYLFYRIQQGYWNTVLEGDWLRELSVDGPPNMVQCTQDSQGWWQQQYDASAYIVTGPMFGRDVPLAGGLPGCWERALLDQEDMMQEEFYNEEFSFPRGNRRPIRLPVIELTLSSNTNKTHLHLDFTLPPGGYATVVLREFGAKNAAYTG